MVTELGRRPWIIYHFMRTKDAVTSMPNVTITFLVMTALYVVLGIIVIWLLSRHVIRYCGQEDDMQRGSHTSGSGSTRAWLRAACRRRDKWRQSGRPGR
jgi:cytochrome bd-type quinol oxidase subunit 1